MRKILYLLAPVLCAGVALASPNDSSGKSTTGTEALPTSNNFYLYPIQIILNSGGKIETLNIMNTSKLNLNAQINLKEYNQVFSNGKLVESSPDITPTAGVRPGVLITPIVLTNIPGEQKQIVRVLATRQESDVELVYRASVKSLTPTGISKSGTIMEIGYTVPIFVLPKNIREEYQLSFITEKNKSYLKIANTGNVHVAFSKITVNNVPLKLDQSRLLAGTWELSPLPVAATKNLAANKKLAVEVTKFKLTDFSNTTIESREISVN